MVLDVPATAVLVSPVLSAANSKTRSQAIRATSDMLAVVFSRASNKGLCSGSKAGLCIYSATRLSYSLNSRPSNSPYWELQAAMVQASEMMASDIGSCKASQFPVYPNRGCDLAVNHATCPSSSSSGCRQWGESDIEDKPIPGALVLGKIVVVPSLNLVAGDNRVDAIQHSLEQPPEEPTARITERQPPGVPHQTASHAWFDLHAAATSA